MGGSDCGWSNCHHKLKMPSTDPNQLVNDARCIARCIPIGMQLPVLISVFIQFINNQSAPQSCFTCSAVDPVAVPACTCALHLNLTDSTLWYWDNTVPTWYKFG